MNRRLLEDFMIGMVLAVMASVWIEPALAQSAAGIDAASANGVTKPSAASSAKSSKAERKAARKQAREKKNAELKKLEDAGYQPGRNDQDYPTDLQNAEKKAGVGKGTSQ